MGKNIYWGSTRSATFQYFYQWHLPIYSKMLPKKLYWWHLSKWFYNYFMVLNPEQFSFMLLGVDYSLQTNIICGDKILKSIKQEKVLGVTLDNTLNTKKANKNFNVLTRVQKHIITDKKAYIFLLYLIAI